MSHNELHKKQRVQCFQSTATVDRGPWTCHITNNIKNIGSNVFRVRRPWTVDMSHNESHKKQRVQCFQSTATVDRGHVT